MLEHGNRQPEMPARVVVIGARGLIGKALVSYLGSVDVPVLALTSDDLDLLAADAADALGGMIKPADAVVMLSALTPDKGRGPGTLMKNLKMAEAVCVALEKTPPAHVVYMSSDAVYPFTSGLVSESSPAAPTDLYGTMHRTREIMFEGVTANIPLAILRCTMVLAEDDPHNSYGPNRFRRQAAAEGKIVLGGNGEETRDHIYVADVAKIIHLVLAHRSAGVLNTVTGNSLSFYDVATKVSELFDPRTEVVCTDRTSPVTYRKFDITAVRRAFPGFRFTPFEEALRSVHAAAVSSE